MTCVKCTEGITTITIGTANDVVAGVRTVVMESTDNGARETGTDNN